MAAGSGSRGIEWALVGYRVSGKKESPFPLTRHGTSARYQATGIRRQGRASFSPLRRGEAPRPALDVPAGRAGPHPDEAEFVSDGLIGIAVAASPFELVETLPIRLLTPDIPSARIIP